MTKSAYLHGCSIYTCTSNIHDNIFNLYILPTAVRLYCSILSRSTFICLVIDVLYHLTFHYYSAGNFLTKVTALKVDRVDILSRLEYLNLSDNAITSLDYFQNIHFPSLVVSTKDYCCWTYHRHSTRHSTRHSNTDKHVWIVDPVMHCKVNSKTTCSGSVSTYAICATPMVKFKFSSTNLRYASISLTT